MNNKKADTTPSFIIEPTKVIESSLRSIQFVDNDGNPVDYRGQPLDAEDPDGRERYWTDRIGGHLRKSAGHVIEAGRDLQTAKDELGHGRFERVVKERLGLGLRMAEMLMKVARHPILSNPNHGSHLPPSARTLSELATLPAPFVEAKIKSGEINAGMLRKDTFRLRDEAKGRDHVAVQHKAKVTPLQQMREEIDAKDGEIADLEERLTAAEADTEEAEQSVQTLLNLKDVEFIVLAIAAYVDAEKGRAIGHGLLAHFAKEEPVYTVEDAPVVAKRRGRPKGSKNKPR